MATPENNLLLRLHKWAWRQDENFLTETLAHLLRHLLDQEPEAAGRLLGLLTAGFLTPEECRSVEIRTQVFTAEGTPDLELDAAQKRVIIEVKSEAEVNPEQLARYRSLLAQGSVPSSLVLLTRYPVTPGVQQEKPVPSVRWYQIAEWLEQERGRYTFKAVSEYLVRQFLEFLGARNMTMAQVTWELSGGVRALRALSDMLYEVASFCGLQVQPFGNRDSMGVYLDRRAYWLGIDYSEPENLWFTTYWRRVDREAAERLGVEGVYEWESEPGWGWRRPLNLESEEVHFFARSKASQMQLLEQFLRQCLDSVQRIEIPGGVQPPDVEQQPNSSNAEPPSPMDQ